VSTIEPTVTPPAVTPPAVTAGEAVSPPRAWTVWISVLGVGLLIGLASFVYQVSNGLGVTGLSNTVTWGLYIVSFMFLVGISAGGLIVVAGAELAGSQRFEHLNRLAVVCSLAAVATAAGSILPDLGRPQRAWKMLAQPHLTSPLVWDMVVLAIYLAIGAIDLYILTRVPVSRKALRVMAIVSLPVAILVHSVTAWIFGLLVARPFWNTPLLAPLFISSALVSGTALVVATAWVVERVTPWRAGAEAMVGLRRLLLWFVSADVFLLFTEVMTTFVSGEPDHREQLDVLLTGRLAPVFWFEIMIGVLLPVVLLLLPSTRKRSGMLMAAAVLLILGVFAKRINILFAAEFEPLVGLSPGIPGGRPGQLFRPDEVYIPSWVELGILTGMAAFFFAIVTLGVQRAVLLRHDEPAAGH
jgi:molybdopterin-containing oxidoreductase family membrane subunit